MEIVLGIALVHLLACLSPGPDIFLVVLNSLRHGRWTGIATTGGILTGVSLHIAFGLTGISYLLAHRPETRNALALAGGAWLIYLGGRGLISWRRQREAPSPAPASMPPLPWRKAWLQGFLVNLLNAKALLFFLSLFSVALGPAVPLPIRVGAGASMIVIQAVAFTAVACLIDRPSLQRGWPRIQGGLDVAISSILLALGAWIAFGTLLFG